MTRTEIPPDDSLALMQAAWQVLRKQYLQLLAQQNSGTPVDWSALAQPFIDMNNALEATINSSVNRSTGGDNAPS